MARHRGEAGIEEATTTLTTANNVRLYTLPDVVDTHAVGIRAILIIGLHAAVYSPCRSRISLSSRVLALVFFVFLFSSAW